MPKPDTTDLGQPASRLDRRLIVLVAAMVVMFVLVVVYRDAIRVRWWAHRLAGCNDPVERLHYAELLASRREGSLPGVRRLMASDDAGVRSMAVMVLNTVQGDAALELLAAAARDPEPVIRRNAIVGISMHEADAAAAALGELIDHPDAASALLAVSRLAGLRTDLADKMLARLAVDHPSTGVRAQAIESVEVRGGDGAVEALTACLEDDAVFSGLTEGERGALAALQSAMMPGRLEGTADASREALGLEQMTNGERAAQALRRLASCP